MKFQCVTIQMKAIEQFFHLLRIIIVYKVVPPCNFVGETFVTSKVKCLVSLHFTTSTFEGETIETKTQSCFFFKSLNEFKLIHLGSENIDIQKKFQLFLTEKWATRIDKYVTRPN